MSVILEIMRPRYLDRLFSRRRQTYFCTAQSKSQEVNPNISNQSSVVIMSDSESQEKGSSSDNERTC